MRVLDCTLRDGGYHNKWDFDSALIVDLLEGVCMSGVDMVELGLRNYPSEGFKGASYFTTEDYINSMNLPTEARYGVMVDAKTLFDRGVSLPVAVDELFCPKSNSKIDFVRLACHFSEVVLTRPIIQRLAELGYSVFVNLMQINMQTDSDIKSVVEEVSSWELEIEALYFADSLGSMDPKDITQTIRLLRQCWNGSLGIHAHNNKGLALENTLIALDLGVEYLDGTVSGMGRGAGNVELEVLLLELLTKGYNQYKPIPLAQVSLRWFEVMKTNFRWGPNLYYRLAAQHKIHPLYVQKILSDTHFSDEEKISALELIPQLAGLNKFDELALSDILIKKRAQTGKDRNDFKSLSEVTSNIGSSSKVLILGAGPSLEKHSTAVTQFARQHGCIVFSLNDCPSELVGTVNYFVTLLNSKRLGQLHCLNQDLVPVILPDDRFETVLCQAGDEAKVLSYGVSIQRNLFSFRSDGCEIPFDLTVAYALAMVMSLGCKNVYLAGFDGYFNDQELQREMTIFLQILRETSPDLNLISITPTSYPIIENSVYEPFL